MPSGDGPAVTERGSDSLRRGSVRCRSGDGFQAGTAGRQGWRALAYFVIGFVFDSAAAGAQLVNIRRVLRLT